MEPTNQPALTVAENDEPSASPAAASRFTLEDVMMGVVAVGLLSSLLRDTKAWSWIRESGELDRTLGLTATGLAVGLAWVLARQVRGLWRATQRFSRRCFWGASAWRFAAAAACVVFAVEQSRLLPRVDPPSTNWSAPRRAIPVVGTLGMAGLAAGLTKGGGRRRPTRIRWASVLLASTAGVVLAAISPGLIDYLVLLAMEAVANALNHPDRVWMSRPSLHRRVAQSGVETLPAVLLCLTLALWLAADLRRPSARRGSAAGLFVLTLLAGASSAWVWFRVIPWISPWLVEGIKDSLRSGVIPWTLLGVGTFSAGIVARAAGEPRTEEARLHIHSRARLLWKYTAVLLLLDLIASRVLRGLQMFRTESSPTLEALERWTGWLVPVQEGFIRYLPAAMADLWVTGQFPEWTFVSLLQLWLAWRVFRLLSSNPTPEQGAEAVAFDAALADGRLFRRWISRTAALTALMLFALPVLAVAGLVLLQFALRPLG